MLWAIPQENVISNGYQIKVAEKSAPHGRIEGLFEQLINIFVSDRLVITRSHQYGNSAAEIW